MSKLLKFRPAIGMDEAAAWLGSLIGEDVSEDDLWNLHLDGHMPLVIGERLMGLPVMPPTEDLSGPWKIVRDGDSSIIPAVYADFLHYPIGCVPTEIGDAPILTVERVPYAWFEDHYAERAKAGSLDYVAPLDLAFGGNTMVCPGEILRIAAAANSGEPVTPCAPGLQENRIWSYASNGARLFHKSEALADGRSVVDAKKPAHPQQDPPSFRLAIAALLELLKSPVERPRPQGMNQAAIKAAILEKFPWRGLSDRSLEKIFATANKAKADAE